MGIRAALYDSVKFVPDLYKPLWTIATGDNAGAAVNRAEAINQGKIWVRIACRVAIASVCTFAMIKILRNLNPISGTVLVAASLAAWHFEVDRFSMGLACAGVLAFISCQFLVHSIFDRCIQCGIVGTGFLGTALTASWYVHDKNVEFPDLSRLKTLTDYAGEKLAFRYV